MARMASEEIRNFVIECLKQRQENTGLKIEEIADDEDLYELGAIDSYDVVDILSQIEKETGIAANLNESDEESFVLSIRWFVLAFS